jgi:hypothetical protein
LYYSHDLFQGEIRERKTELKGKNRKWTEKKSQKENQEKDRRREKQMACRCQPCGQS